MNNEIKEIREYISCPQFGDDHYGKWGALRLEQRIKIKQLLDYITNLQKENENLKNIISSVKEDFLNANSEAIDYKSRNERAIKYINENILISFDKVGFNKDIVSGIVVNDLLNILEGSDKSE